jgi:hypothetical protein
MGTDVRELTLPEKFDVFLEELTALTHKYGIEIDGCGCCNSPYLGIVRPEQNDHHYSVQEGFGLLRLRSVEDIEEWKENERERAALERAEIAARKAKERQDEADYLATDRKRVKRLLST